MWLRNKLVLVDTIITDFLKDIKSLRYQLILAAFAFNIYLVKHSSAAVQIAGIGLLTAVYSMYFYSRHQQAKNEMLLQNLQTQTKKEAEETE